MKLRFMTWSWISKGSRQTVLFICFTAVTATKWIFPSRMKYHLGLDVMLCSIFSCEWEVFVQPAKSQDRSGGGDTPGMRATSCHMYQFYSNLWTMQACCVLWRLLCYKRRDGWLSGMCSYLQCMWVKFNKDFLLRKCASIFSFSSLSHLQSF